MYCPLLLLAARFLSRLGCLPDVHGNEMPTVTPCCDPLHYPRKPHVKHYEFRLRFFPRKVSILMRDRWSLREIWLQSVYSSISKFRFAEQGPRSLRIRTQCSLVKSGSQLSRKSERLHHPTGHASAVCRTFEMTYVVDYSRRLGCDAVLLGQWFPTLRSTMWIHFIEDQGPASRATHLLICTSKVWHPRCVSTTM